MDVSLDPRATQLLALMHEADAEAVTLDELAVAGVDDPAQALHALELAGFTVERVTDRTAAQREVECVRLARLAAAHPPPTEPATVEWPAPTATSPAPGAPDRAPAPAGPAFGGSRTTAVLDAPPASGGLGADRARRRTGRRAELVAVADRRPLVLALLALVLVVLLGRAVADRRG